MKGFSELTLGLLTAVMLVAGPRAGAQGFGLSVTPSASSLMVSNSLTYTINVTNLTGFNLLAAAVTNILPASTQFQTASNYYSGAYSRTNNVVVFDLGSFPAGQPAQMAVTIMPTAVGFITNAVTVGDPAEITNTASTNVVVQVTNVAPAQADLGVAMTGPKQVVITNDWMTYSVAVTNAGPDAAPNVVLTNAIPTDVILKAIFPNLTYTRSGSNMLFNLGALTSGGNEDLQFTVEPTNVATLLFSASVGAAGVTDANTANNFASTNIPVTAYLPGALVAVTNSPQRYDMQNNLVEQGILLTNQGTNLVAAARIVVSGLATTNALFNAVGTNNGNPFVVYDSSLAAGQSGELLLQYAANNYFSFTNSQLRAFAVTPPDLTAPLATAVSTNVNIISIGKLSSGRILIWFPSVSNGTYTVVYSSDLSSTNWLMAQPPVRATTTDTEWIDYGPPATASAPTNATARFYRVYQDP